jgi:hypothetical protein
LVTFYKWWKSWQKTDNVFLPTECYRMLKNIGKQFPNGHLIISDFDLLRESYSSLMGVNAPIVSRKLKESSDKQDFDDIYVKRGEADIFFPTNFRLLREMVKSATGKEAEYMKSWQFMDKYSDVKWSTTRSGYNPLKEDFLNTSFLITKSNSN